MRNGYGLIFIGVIAGTCVLTLVPLVGRVAVLYGVTDKPAPTKLHTRPTPYLGGVAIALGALFASPFLQSWRAEGAVLLLGGVIVSLAGLVDDLRTLGPLVRVFIETGAAIMAAAAGARVHLFGGPVDWVLSVVWIVVITNSFNLLDNMDGAAGVIATTTAVAVAVAAGLQGQWLVGGLAAALAGACIGFLRYNWHPARIFMGDAGSLFLGYLLACIGLKLRFPVPHAASIPAVLLLTGPALFDTTLVFVSRVRRGVHFYDGGTDHTSHRLLRMGLGHQQVALVLAAACSVCCGLGVLVGRGTLDPTAVSAPVAFVFGGLLVAFLRQEDAAIELAVQPLSQ